MLCSTVPTNKIKSASVISLISVAVESHLLNFCPAFIFPDFLLPKKSNISLQIISDNLKNIPQTQCSMRKYPLRKQEFAIYSHSSLSSCLINGHHSLLAAFVSYSPFNISFVFVLCVPSFPMNAGRRSLPKSDYWH